MNRSHDAVRHVLWRVHVKIVFPWYFSNLPPYGSIWIPFRASKSFNHIWKFFFPCLIVCIIIFLCNSVVNEKTTCLCLDQLKSRQQFIFTANCLFYHRVYKWILSWRALCNLLWYMNWFNQYTLPFFAGIFVFQMVTVANVKHWHCAALDVMTWPKHVQSFA